MAGPSLVRAEYEKRRAAFHEAATAEQQRFLQIGNVRLVTALAAAAIAYLSLASHTISPMWLVAPVGVFVVLMIWHENTLRRQKRAERARRLYEQGLARLSDEWMGKGVAGERFRDPQHPYADDLDVFGRGSLFELLCTVRTPLGEETLATWLKRAAEPETVRDRQDAIAELRPRIDLREQLALLGEEVGEGMQPAALVAWAKGAGVAFPRWTRGVGFVSSAASIGWGVFVIRNGWPISFAVLPIVVQILFGFWLRPRVLQVLADVDAPGRDLLLLAQVLSRLESEPFTSGRLAALQQKLRTAAGSPPSREIAHLQRLRELLDSRKNAFFAPVAALLLWGTQFGLSLEQWRRAHGSKVADWLDTLGEMEALTSLGGYSFEHPEDPFPEIVESGTASLEFRKAGHPLLPESQCVRNDVALGPDLRLLIISGSNMSGKSTLLRSVGLNVVLAFAGAPVRAEFLRLSPVAVGTSLRPQDSLQTGTSRFYAEITRLRDLVALSHSEVPLLFLLDELLSGTNSFDRQRGSEGVLRGLLETQAIGMMTTHDLALAALADELRSTKNVHFEDRLIDGKLVFDYQLRQGVVQRSNAIELMRSIGLDV